MCFFFVFCSGKGGGRRFWTWHTPLNLVKKVEKGGEILQKIGSTPYISEIYYFPGFENPVLLVAMVKICTFCVSVEFLNIGSPRQLAEHCRETQDL